MHRSAGFTLIDIVLVVAVVSTALVLFFPAISPSSRKRQQTHDELLTLGNCILDYVSDVGEAPATLSNLMVRPQATSGWMGPYVRWQYTDAVEINDGFQHDAWREPYLMEVTGLLQVRLRSKGEDRVDEEGMGDDLQLDIDLGPALRKVTREELRSLNGAVDSYNAVHLPGAPLPDDFLLALDVLQSSGYLPADADSTQTLSLDGWGRPYQTVGPPLLEIISAETP